MASGYDETFMHSNVHTLAQTHYHICNKPTRHSFTASYSNNHINYSYKMQVMTVAVRMSAI